MKNNSFCIFLVDDIQFSGAAVEFLRTWIGRMNPQVYINYSNLSQIGAMVRLYIPGFTFWILFMERMTKYAIYEHFWLIRTKEYWNFDKKRQVIYVNLKKKYVLFNSILNLVFLEQYCRIESCARICIP